MGAKEEYWNMREQLREAMWSPCKVDGESRPSLARVTEILLL